MKRFKKGDFVCYTDAYLKSRMRDNNRGVVHRNYGPSECVVQWKGIFTCVESNETLKIDKESYLDKFASVL